jgi:arylamine N-acetyltransferase
MTRTEESKAVAELLTLLEQTIARLARRDRRFRVARIGGMTLQRSAANAGLREREFFKRS